MRVKTAVCSSIGKKRKINQDNFYLNGLLNGKYYSHFDSSNFSSKKEQILAVCDGMGGEKHGEIASYISVKKLKDYDGKYSNLFNRFPEHIKKYTESSNKAICEYMMYHGNERMGSTFAILCISPENKEAIAANLGDSKIYYFHAENLKKISEDHNQAQSLVNMEMITEEEAREHPGKSKLTQHLGIFPNEMLLEPYISENIMLSKGDIFLICSDGLTDMLSDDEILDYMRTKERLSKRCKQLVKKAEEKGGKDNITVIIAEII